MPNWRTLGGYRYFWAMRTDTEEVVATELVRADSALYAEEVERRRIADGTEREVGALRAVAPEILSDYDVQILRRWKAEGARIVGGLVKVGRGRSLTWAEPVPVLLNALDAPRGRHHADRLVLHTRKFEAAIAHDVSLFALADYADNGDGTGTGRVALPLPGLTVYGLDETGYDVVTLKAFGRGGSAKATATVSKIEIPNPATPLTLPAGTVYVEVTGPYYGPGVKPLLVTAPISAAEELVGGFEEGTKGAENGYDYVTLTPWGVAEAEEYQEVVTFGGVDYTIDVVELGPPGLTRLLVHPDPDHPLGIEVITQDEP